MNVKDLAKLVSDSKSRETNSILEQVKADALAGESVSNISEEYDAIIANNLKELGYTVSYNRAVDRYEISGWR